MIAAVELKFISTIMIGAATFAGVVGVADSGSESHGRKEPIVSIMVFTGVALFYVLHRLIPR